MTKTSIDYSMRPNKSLVRNRIVDIVDERFHPTHEHLADVSYISLCGYRFIDAIEFYKRFNIRRIYSVEKYDKIYARAIFNRPYEFINITKGTIKTFIDNKYSEVVETRKAIYLDYESRIDDKILSELEAVISSGFLDRDTLLFITFNRGFDRNLMTPRVLEVVPENIKTTEAFKTWLSNEFSDLIVNFIRRKYRQQKSLEEVLKAFYYDTANMVILGYFISESGSGDFSFKSIPPETFALPELTPLEENHLKNHLSDDLEELAEVLGLASKEVKAYTNYV